MLPGNTAGPFDRAMSGTGSEGAMDKILGLLSPRESSTGIMRPAADAGEGLQPKRPINRYTVGRWRVGP